MNPSSPKVTLAMKFRDSAEFKTFLKYYYYFKFYSLSKIEMIFAPSMGRLLGHSEKQFPCLFICTGFPHRSLEIHLDRGLHDDMQVASQQKKVSSRAEVDPRTYFKKDVLRGCIIQLMFHQNYPLRNILSKVLLK